MTLVCDDCGGALELTAQHYPDSHDKPAREQYECVNCGGTGSYTFGPDTERMTGCVGTTDDLYL